MVCIEEPHTVHGARHTAGFRYIHEQSWCTRQHQVLGSPWAISAIWWEWKHGHREESKTSKRGRCKNQYCISHETRFSKDNSKSTYFMIFWNSWNWSSYSRECLLYWLRWHLVVELSSLTVKEPMSALRYFRLWMWRQVGTVHCSYSSCPTDYGNSHVSGFNIQNTLNTSHCSQHKMNGRLWSKSWKY